MKREPSRASDVLARTTGGAITGALIGFIADPFTAVVGAAACAVLGAADGFNFKGSGQQGEDEFLENAARNDQIPLASQAECRER